MRVVWHLAAVDKHQLLKRAKRTPQLGELYVGNKTLSFVKNESPQSHPTSISSLNKGLCLDTTTTYFPQDSRKGDSEYSLHRHRSRVPLSRLWLQSWSGPRSSQGFSRAGPFPCMDIIPTPKCEHMFDVNLLCPTQRHLQYYLGILAPWNGALSLAAGSSTAPERRCCHYAANNHRATVILIADGPLTPGHCRRQRISLWLQGASQSSHFPPFPPSNCQQAPTVLS